MRDTDPQKALNYISKSKEFLEMAKLAAQHANYNSAVTSAIHSAISALDALTTSYKGKRGSGNHAEVLSIVQGIILAPQEYREIRKQFTSIISKKNAVEYQPDLMTAKDARDAITWAERIFDKAKGKME